MNDHTFTTLRAANAARQVEWDDAGQVSPSYRGNEMAGEIGEALEAALDFLNLAVAGGRACNLIKKLDREALGIRGSRATLEEVAAELADVSICADLAALRLGIDLDAAVAAKFNETSIKVGLRTRLEPPGEVVDVGRFVASLKAILTAIRTLDGLGAALEEAYRLVALAETGQ